jgi:hypothetical protein
MKPDDDDNPLTPAQARQKLQKGLEDCLAGNDTGPIVFRLKRTKKASHTYPLKLTQQQRETLLEHTNLSGKLKKKIEQAGEGTQVVPVTWNELHKLNDETGQAAVYARSPHKKRLLAVMSRVVKFFEEEHAEVFDLAAPTPAKRRPAKTDLLFQFKITLLGAKPPIWRRIQVQDCTLDKLHEHIQTAMGWTNSHLHQFEIKGERYGDPELLDDGFEDFECVDSTKTNLSQILPKTGKRFAFKYEYDFGDGWEHEVLFEGNPATDPKAKSPLCVEGERACPPEDCGGIWGYGDFLEAIRNPKHEEHESMLEWIGGRFDPEEFNAKAATKAMKKGMPDWRSMR